MASREREGSKTPVSGPGRRVSSPFRVEVTGPGLEIKRNLLEEDAFKIAWMVARAPNVMSEADMEEFKRRVIVATIKKTFERDSPGNNAARIAVVVRTASKHWQRPITREELTELFAQTGVALPSNFSRDLAQAEERGMISVVELADGEEGYEAAKLPE